MSSLFEPITLGPLTLKNRTVMAPLTRSRAIDNVPNDLMATYYQQRAGAGLIITEGTSPAPEGLGYARIPGAFNDAHEAGWKLVTDAVHDAGGAIFLQLMHTGRVSHPHNVPGGAIIQAPSAIAPAGTKMYTDVAGGEEEIPKPAAMDVVQIKAATNAYVQASKLAIRAGFDGVELHAANGYLMEQFLNPKSNQRTDSYGGSPENRRRFVVETAKAVAEAIGADRVGIRISPYGVFNDTGAFEGIDAFYTDLARELSDVGLVYIHMVDHSAMGTPEVPDSVKDGVREAFKGRFILSGGYDRERAQADLDADKGDLVAFGRPFLANPDLVERMKAGAELNEPRHELFYTPGPEGYTDYPTMDDAA